MADQLAISLLVVGALVVRTALGFGFSLVFIPAGSVLLGFSTAFLVSIVLELVVSTLMAAQLRHHLQLLNAFTLKFWGFLGVVVGLMLRTVAREETVVGVSMAAIVVACLALLAADEFTVKRSRGKLMAAGASSGFLNSWTSLSGPPVVFYYLLTEEDQRGVRGALAGYFWILYSVTFLLLLVQGDYADFDAWPLLAGPLVSIAVSFPWLSRSRRLRELDIRRPALILLAITATMVAVGQFL